MIYCVADVNDPQGKKTEVEANTAQEAANKWGKAASYPDDSQYSLQGYAIVRVCKAGTEYVFGEFKAYLKPEEEDGED